jgi:hypothetical protein
MCITSQCTHVDVVDWVQPSPKVTDEYKIAEYGISSATVRGKAGNLGKA